MSFIVWFTGLTGSGKSTLSQELARRIRKRGVRHVQVLDEDEVTHKLTTDTRISRARRKAQVLRVGYLADLLSKNGVPTICAMGSPHASDRSRVRWVCVMPFIEVHCLATLETAMRRTKSDLYEQAKEGRDVDLPGVSYVYEDPTKPELILDTEVLTVDQCVSNVIVTLETRGLIETLQAVPME